MNFLLRTNIEHWQSCEFFHCHAKHNARNNNKLDEWMKQRRTHSERDGNTFRLQKSTCKFWADVSRIADVYLFIRISFPLSNSGIFVARSDHLTHTHTRSQQQQPSQSAAPYTYNLHRVVVQTQQDDTHIKRFCDGWNCMHFSFDEIVQCETIYR